MASPAHIEIAASCGILIQSQTPKLPAENTSVGLVTLSRVLRSRGETAGPAACAQHASRSEARWWICEEECSFFQALEKDRMAEQHRKPAARNPLL